MPRDKRSAHHVTLDERGGTDDFAPATVIAVAEVRGSQKFVKCEDDKTSRQAGSAFGIALLSQRGRIRRLPAKYRANLKTVATRLPRTSVLGTYVIDCLVLHT